MIIKKRGNRFSENLKPENEFHKSSFIHSFFYRLTQKVSTRVGAAAISALIALHFISQFIFFQNENVQIEENILKPAAELIVESKPQQITIAPSALAKPETSETISPSPARKTDPPAQKIVKKKQIRETKAERLRRAEKLLTGV